MRDCPEWLFFLFVRVEDRAWQNSRVLPPRGLRLGEPAGGIPEEPVWAAWFAASWSMLYRFITAASKCEGSLLLIMKLLSWSQAEDLELATHSLPTLHCASAKSY